MNDQALTREIASEGATLAQSGDRPTGPLVLLDRVLAGCRLTPSRASGSASQGEDRWFRSSAVRLIGPSSSDSLRTLYHELLGWLALAGGLR